MLLNAKMNNMEKLWIKLNSLYIYYKLLNNIKRENRKFSKYILLILIIIRVLNYLVTHNLHSLCI